MPFPYVCERCGDQVWSFTEINESSGKTYCKSCNSAMMPTEKAATPDQLLERIRARRLLIRQRRGMLAESYPLIREDRER